MQPKCQSCPSQLPHLLLPDRLHVQVFSEAPCSCAPQFVLPLLLSASPRLCRSSCRHLLPWCTSLLPLLAAAAARTQKASRADGGTCTCTPPTQAHAVLHHTAPVSSSHCCIDCAGLPARTCSCAPTASTAEQRADLSQMWGAVRAVLHIRWLPAGLCSQALGRTAATYGGQLKHRISKRMEPPDLRPGRLIINEGSAVAQAFCMMHKRPEFTCLVAAREACEAACPTEADVRRVCVGGAGAGARGVHDMHRCWSSRG